MSEIPSESVEHYVVKAQEHLLRHLAIYEAAHLQLEKVVTEQADAFAALLGPVAVPEPGRAADRAARAALVGLKSEFEVFLKILATKVVLRAIQGIREHRTHSPGLEKLLNDSGRKEFVTQCVETGFDDPIATFVINAVPRHGLHPLVNTLEAMKLRPHPTPEDDAEFHRRFTVASGTTWDQIRAAFAVRHAIEHNRGRLTVREIWNSSTDAHRLGSSTWSRLMPKDKQDSTTVQVSVSRNDLAGTAAAMTIAVRRLGTVYKRYDADLSA